METIVVSVLSTLGVVALVMTFVVAFIKLKNKVGVNKHEKDVESLHLEIIKLRNDIESSTALDEVYRLINTNNEEIWRESEKITDQIRIQVEDVRSFIDSRCDRLDNKIKGSKQILTD